MIHRDIKLDNFIYEDDREDAELKLIDFGFACEVPRSARDRVEIGPRSRRDRPVIASC